MNKKYYILIVVSFMFQVMSIPFTYLQSEAEYIKTQINIISSQLQTIAESISDLHEWDILWLQQQENGFNHLISENINISSLRERRVYKHRQQIQESMDRYLAQLVKRKKMLYKLVIAIELIQQEYYVEN